MKQDTHQYHGCWLISSAALAALLSCLLMQAGLGASIPPHLQAIPCPGQRATNTQAGISWCHPPKLLSLLKEAREDRSQCQHWCALRVNWSGEQSWVKKIETASFL